jgi:MFS family permease
MRRIGLGVDYRRIWTAAAISNLGDGVFLTALPLLAASISHDPIAVSMVTLALTTPWLLLALVSGALVDRWDRLAVMWRVDLARFALTVGLGVTVLTDQVTIPALIGFAFALGAAETLFDTAALAVIPAIVGTSPDRLHRANARLENARIVATGFVGPPLGGGLFTITPALPIFFDAVSFLASTLLLRGVPTRAARSPAPTRSTIRGEITEGLRWLWAEPVLRMLAATVGVMNLGFAASTTLLVLLLQDRAGVGPFGYGLILGMAAVGAVIGNLWAERFGWRCPIAPTLTISVTLCGAALVTIGVKPTAATITLLFALASGAGAVWNVLTVSLRQSVIPAPLLGRVNSVYRFVAYGTMPAGALLGGVLASHAGLAAPFLASGMVILGVVPFLAATVTPAALSALAVRSD